MANETQNNLVAAVTSLIETLGKLGNQQIDLVTNGIKSASTAVEPLIKSAIELAGNVVGALNQIMQNVSTAIAPKK